MAKSPTSPKTVAITGAGQGLGAALARAFAISGARLYLSGRKDGPLQQVTRDCQAVGAQVETAIVDVRDLASVQDWLAGIESAVGVDLMIVNAGLFGGRPAPDVFEPTAVSKTLIETNLTAAIQCAYAAAERMKARGHGHIALVSSLAAKLPSADAPSYSASKAGLSAFGNALREDLSDHGVDVSLIHPGHIETFQSKQQSGPLPMMITTDEAAMHIMYGLNKRRVDISFPFWAVFWVRLLAFLPWRLRARLGRSQRFTVTNRETTP